MWNNYIYGPRNIIKKNYDSLVDSFNVGIVLYILCSGGMHLFIKREHLKKIY